MSNSKQKHVICTKQCNKITIIIIRMLLWTQYACDMFLSYLKRLFFILWDVRVVYKPEI